MRSADPACSVASDASAVRVPDIVDVGGTPAPYGLYPDMAVRSLDFVGLCVEIPSAWSISSDTIVAVGGQWPPAGTSVPRGNVVSLDIGARWPGGMGTPASPIDRKSRPMPDMRNWTLGRALDWAYDGRVGWQVDSVPALPASRQASLVSAFRVVGQSPAAGISMVGSDGDRIVLRVEVAAG